MTRLTPTQMRALERLWTSQHQAEPAGAFGRGIGKGTLDGLVALGLATYGEDRHGDVGYQITPAGDEAHGRGYY